MKPVRPIDCLFSAQKPNLQLAGSDTGRPRPIPCPSDPAGLIELMDCWNIERVLLSPCHVRASRCDRQYLCGDAIVSDLLHSVSGHPERFSALVGYNVADIGDSLHLMDEAIGKQDCKGLSVSSGDAPLLDRRMYPAYAKCAELHVPVMIHGNNELAWSVGWPSFDDVLIIATDFPELKVVAACDCWPSVDEIRRLLDRCENIYFAVDANPRRDLLPEVSALLNSDRGRTRCVWGSNACAWEQTTKQVEQLALDDDARSQFVRDNAVALFALEQQRRPGLEAELILTGE